MQKFSTRTDLASELVGNSDATPAGAERTVFRAGGFSVERMTVRTESAERTIGKPCGTYVTIRCGAVTGLGEERCESLSRLIAGELRGMAERLTGKKPDADFSVFAAGLGNAELTADAVGPATVGKLTATRHLKEHAGEVYRDLGCSSLSALSPGVLGQTGIETLELLRGAVEAVKPDLAVVIDALAARSCDRLAATVQISDAGIEPGSGVGNHRSAVTEASLGVPVVVLGVPTVVDSATLVYDALERAGIDRVSDDLGEVLEKGRNFFVSPRDSDRVTDLFSNVLSRALRLAFTNGI